MFNEIIKKFGYKKINAGIGIGCDENLIIKAGRTGTGINDKIWIGKGVVDAANLSSLAGRKGIEPIAMSQLFYDNIIDILNNEDSGYKTWIMPKKNYYGTIEFYHCDVTQIDFHKWIMGGMN